MQVKMWYGKMSWECTEFGKVQHVKKEAAVEFKSILFQQPQTVLFNLPTAFLLIVEAQQNYFQSMQDCVWSIQKRFGDTHLNSFCFMFFWTEVFLPINVT